MPNVPNALVAEAPLQTRDLHGPGGPASRAGTGRAEAGRAHKPTKWNGPGRAGLFIQRAGPGRSGPVRAGPGLTFFR